MPHLNGGKATGFIKEMAKGFLVNRKGGRGGFQKIRRLSPLLARRARRGRQRDARPPTTTCRATPGPPLLSCRGEGDKRPPVLDRKSVV